MTTSNDPSEEPRSSTRASGADAPDAPDPTRPTGSAAGAGPGLDPDDILGLEPEDGEPADPITGRTPGMARVLLKGTSWQALGQFAPLIINLVLTPYIIHGLGPRLYGVFLVVNSVQAMMGMFNGGIGPAVTRYLTIYAGRGDRETATRLVLTMSLVVLVIVLVVFGLFFALVPQVVAFFPSMAPDPQGAAFLLGTQVLLLAVLQVRGIFQSVLFAQQRFAVTSIAYLLGHVVYTIGLVITVENRLGLHGIAWTFVAQQVLSTVVIVPPALGYLTRKGAGLLDRSLFREFFGYAWKAQLSGLLDMLTQQIDVLLVGRLRAGDVVHFGPGATFAQQMRMVPMNAAGPMETIVGRAVGEKGEAGAVEDYVRLQRLWVRAVTGWFAVAVPAAFFGVVAWLNLGSTPGLVAAILLLAHWFAMLIRVQMLWCLSLRRAGLDVEQGICFLVLKVVLTLALLVPFGLVGIIVATVLAQLASSVYLTWRMRTLPARVPSPWPYVPWLNAVVCGAVAGVCVWAASLLVGPFVPHGALGLLVCGVAAGPALVLYMVWTVGRSDLLRLMPARFARLLG